MRYGVIKYTVLEVTINIGIVFTNLLLLGVGKLRSTGSAHSQMIFVVNPVALWDITLFQSAMMVSKTVEIKVDLCILVQYNGNK